MHKTKEEETAYQIASSLNALVIDNKKICAEMSKAHRTIQQSFTRLCLEWLKTCASDNYNFDERNQASHEVAKELLDGKDDFSLPFI